MTRRRALAIAAILPLAWLLAFAVGTGIGVALCERNMRACSGAED